MSDEVKEEVKNEYQDFPDDFVLSVTSTGDFDDYVELPAEEPLYAHVVKVKQGRKVFKKSGDVREDWMYVWFEIDEETGKGQRYRGDFNPKLNDRTDLGKFLKDLYGDFQEQFVPKDILGMPIRVELSEPWGDKKMQFVNATKKPKPDQKKVEVKTEGNLPEVATEKPEIEDFNLDEALDGAGVK